VKSKVFWGLCIGLLGTLATGLVSANDVTSVLKAPEIDPASATSALTFLIGGLAVLRGRKRA
jgi:hypothetical protein